MITDGSFYVLRFDRDAYNAVLVSGTEIGDKGVEGGCRRGVGKVRLYILFEVTH
jgi:hypothetical protein